MQINADRLEVARSLQERSENALCPNAGMNKRGDEFIGAYGSDKAKREDEFIGAYESDKAKREDEFIGGYGSDKTKREDEFIGGYGGT